MDRHEPPASLCINSLPVAVFSANEYCSCDDTCAVVVPVVGVNVYTQVPCGRGEASLRQSWVPRSLKTVECVIQGLFGPRWKPSHTGLEHVGIHPATTRVVSVIHGAVCFAKGRLSHAGFEYI